MPDLARADHMAVAAPAGFASRLIVDLDALRRNFAALAAHVRPARCAAVVKANAYGLGARPVAAALLREGCRHFFVAQLCEALEIADTLDAGCTIFILNGLEPDDQRLCAERGFVPLLNSVQQVEAWRAAAVARQRRLPAALQLDSGMSRLGLSPAELVRLAGDSDLVRHLSLRLLVSHLACADSPRHRANRTQLARFAQARALFPGVPASIGNSAGAYLDSAFRCDMVRSGLALYGAAASLAAPPPALVVRLEARVLQLRDVSAGCGIGYGLDDVASTPRRIATIGFGYGDGWPRSLGGGRGAVRFGDAVLPIVGRVSMDSMMVDVTEMNGSEPNCGDLVELIGPRQSIEAVADAAGTIPYEILTRLGNRAQRMFIEGGNTLIQPAGFRA